MSDNSAGPGPHPRTNWGAWWRVTPREIHTHRKTRYIELQYHVPPSCVSGLAVQAPLNVITGRNRLLIMSIPFVSEVASLVARSGWSGCRSCLL